MAVVFKTLFALTCVFFGKICLVIYKPPCVASRRGNTAFVVFLHPLAQVVGTAIIGGVVFVLYEIDVVHANIIPKVSAG